MQEDIKTNKYINKSNKRNNKENEKRNKLTEQCKLFQRASLFARTDAGVIGDGVMASGATSNT